MRIPTAHWPRGLVDVPAHWLTKSIGPSTEARVALQPRRLNHDRLGLFSPDPTEEDC